MKYLFLLVVLSVLLCAEGRLQFYTKKGSTDQSNEKISVQDDEALFLTPLIEAGKLDEARSKSKVSPDILDTQSYSGFLTVNKSCDNNLFFWFFLAEENSENAPVVLWLQGGPGVSSMFGLFEENGPFKVVNGEFEKRDLSWHKKNNMLYIDQPANTGFSFSGKGCYVKTDRQCGIEVHSALVQFFTLFPKLAANKFFITGESYAGHYIPHLGKVIYERNPTSNVKINLKGAMIGNPLIDMAENYNWAPLLQGVGLIDNKQSQEIQNAQRIYSNISSSTTSQDEREKAREAYLPYIFNAVYYINIYDYMNLNDSLEIYKFAPALTRPNIRKAIHVGNLNFITDADHLNRVVDALFYEYIGSAAKVYEECLELFPITVYVGQRDIICGYPQVASQLDSFKWSGTTKFQNSERQRWCLNDKLCGFHRCAGNLCEVMIRNAPHAVPQQQPEACLALLDSFTTSPSSEPLKALVACYPSKNVK